MKNIKNLFIVLVSVLFCTIGCQEELETFGDLKSPKNLVINYTIQGKTPALPNGDGSGKVDFIAKAENAISYKFIFSDGTESLIPGGVFTKRFTTNGTNNYTVQVVATGTGGVSTSTTINLDVFSLFDDSPAIQFLTDGSSKKWYWAAAEPGHLGVGPNSNDASQNYYPHWYQAAPFEKEASPNSDCLYDNELTFSLVGGVLKYELNNFGKTFFNKDFRSVVSGTENEDFCYNYNTSGQKTVTLSPSDSFVTQNPLGSTQTRGTMMNFSNNGFMGYYIGQSSYEILSITSNKMVVRAVMGGNPALAWYHTFTTTQPVFNPPNNYTNLVWSDEFNVDGAPDTTKWSYDLGTGNNGWGNQEVQTYTNNPANVSVANGNLKITAIKAGSTYTSARLKTENKYEFKYGKIEVKAKLPTGGGTWPAIWMLGANYDQTGFTWPACGEIDIMEHKGNQQDVIYGTLHYPGVSPGGGNGASTNVANVSSEFKVYSVIWSPTSIQFFVNGTLFHSVPNNNSVPFNHDFFLILNVAMGGTFGGAISPTFVQSSMEVDYIRVYQ